MGEAGQRFFMQLAISAVVAVATPALAAGLVAGASVAASVGGDALNGAIGPGAATPDIDSDPSPYIATHDPARLSALAGNDDAARESVRSVHVRFAHGPR